MESRYSGEPIETLFSGANVIVKAYITVTAEKGSVDGAVADGKQRDDLEDKGLEEAAQEKIIFLRSKN